MKYTIKFMFAIGAVFFAACQTGSTYPSATQRSPSGNPSNGGYSSDPHNYDTFRYHAPGRVVAIGDLHGDFAAMEGALRVAGAIDDSNHWIGGSLVLIQTGDQIDRWDEDREILDFLSHLQKEAKLAGGQVILLNGDHELMNVGFDLRYVTPGAFKKFLDFPTSSNAEPLPGSLKLSDGDRWGLPGVVTDLTTPGVPERVEAFRPGHPYAELLASRPLYAIVNDTVFVHGGLSMEYIASGLTRLNEEVRKWLLGETPIRDLSMKAKETVTGSDPKSPAWNRTYSEGTPDAKSCERLQAILTLLGVKRMVVGHTPQRQGINAACDGRVWRIDIGLSRPYGYVNPEVLAIDQDQIQILRPQKMDLRNIKSRTPLHHAAAKGDLIKVKELLRAGANKNMPTRSGATPLAVAVYKNHLDVVHALIEAEADLDRANKNGMTPLFVAVVEGYAPVVEALVQAGADKDKGTKGDATPLAEAAPRGELQIVKVLVEAGANMEKATVKGLTPLAGAVLGQKEAVVEYLLQAGANPRSKTKNGQSILDMAKHLNNRKIEKLIEEAL